MSETKKGDGEGRGKKQETKRIMALDGDSSAGDKDGL
jgi:hypothetical protein